ncbi:MAG: chromate transporter [Propionivibrio sp.]
MPLGNRAGPKSLSDLSLTLTGLALQGFGGVLAVVQHELVERKRWLTKEEFVEEWAVAQILPGPNVINLCLMIGSRYFGWRGALAALAGMLCVPTVGVLALAVAYARYGAHPVAIGALRGMGAIAAGLIIAAGLRLAGALKSNPLGVPLCVALGVITFVGIAVLRLPLVYILCGPGALGCVLAYRRLGGQ